MKIRIFITGIFLFSQSMLWAHNPSQSSLTFSIYAQTGFLELSLAQYGIEQALVKKYPDLDLKVIEQKDFKELLVEYLKETIMISANGQPLKIGRGVIKLGNHQTDLKFQVDNIPEELNMIEVDAHCFHENKNHQNFFTLIYKDLNARDKLSQENNFKSLFTISASEMRVKADTDNMACVDSLWPMAAISLLPIILYSIIPLIT